MLRHFHDVRKGPHSHLLSGGGALLQHTGRRLRVFSVFYEAAHNIWQVLKPHEEDQSALLPGQRAVIENGRPVFMAAFMAGDHMEGRSVIPVGHRNPAVSRYRIRGRDARHHHEIHAGSPQLLPFLTAAPENVRVAAF